MLLLQTGQGHVDAWHNQVKVVMISALSKVRSVLSALNWFKQYEEDTSAAVAITGSAFTLLLAAATIAFVVPSTITIIGAAPSQTSQTVLFDTHTGITLTCNAYCKTYVPASFDQCYVQLAGSQGGEQCIAMKLGETRSFQVSRATPTLTVLTKGSSAVTSIGACEHPVPPQSVATCTETDANLAPGTSFADAAARQASAGCGSGVTLHTSVLDDALLGPARDVAIPLSYGIYTLQLTRQRHIDSSLAPFAEPTASADLWAPLFSSFMPLALLPTTEEVALACFNEKSNGPSRALQSTQLPAETRAECSSTSTNCGQNPKDWQWVRMQIPSTVAEITTTRLSWVQALVAAVGGFWSLATAILGLAVALVLAGVDLVAGLAGQTKDVGFDDDADAAGTVGEAMPPASASPKPPGWRREAAPSVEMVAQHNPAMGEVSSARL